MKTIKVLVQNEVWEKFYRLFPSQGERSRIIRNFIFRKIREETARLREEKMEKER